MPGPVRSIVVACVVVIAITLPALAWPDRPVRIVVGFQAGGSSDVVSRIAAERLRGQLGGATIIVDNKPGAAGAIAADVVLGAHDGHTLLTFSDSLLTTALINKSVRYQPLRDFKMISLLCEGTLVLLAASNAPFRDFAEFVAYARANPGKITYASAGIGGHQHLTGEYISAALKIDLTHVPTRGGAQATTDLVGGQVDAAILGPGADPPAHPCRQGEGARRHPGGARAAAARCSDPDRAWSGRLHRRPVVRPGRPGRHAAGHRRPAGARDRHGAR